jgi:hypothetical protein
MFTMNEIYNYVFESTPQLKADAPAAQKKSENSIKEKFNPILIGDLALPFRKLLRDNNSKELEKLLYGNDQDLIAELIDKRKAELTNAAPSIKSDAFNG